MKNIYNIIILFTLILQITSCSSEKRIKITNESELSLKDKAVIIPREQLSKYLSSNQILVFKKADQVIPVQYDDLDGDGEWDEAFLVLDFAPKETISISVSSSTDKVEFKERARVLMGYDTNKGGNYTQVKSWDFDTTVIGSVDKQLLIYQCEGVVLENEEISFRHYFDERNSKDIYGKITSEMMMHKESYKTNYSVLDDWGMDVLKVGQSLGSGASCLEVDGRLYKFTNFKSLSAKTISDGPLRAIVDTRYDSCNIKGNYYSYTERTTIVAGESGFTSQIILENKYGDENLAVGLVNKHNDALFSSKVQNSKIYYTHDKQSENHDYLGMSLIVDADQLIAQGETLKQQSDSVGVFDTYYLTLPYKVGESTKYQFKTFWEKRISAVKDREAYKKLVEAECNKEQAKISISL